MAYKRTIENLALEGGGVRGIAYTGALQVLEDCNIMSGIKNVAGTSVGAIVAAFMSIGMTSKEIQDALFQKNFSDFQDKHKLGELSRKYGWHSGNNFLNWLKFFIKQKTGNENTTFADLKQNCKEDSDTYKSLTVFATDLNEHKVVAFSSHHNDSNMLKVPIAEAVRASMSIPMFFDAWQFPAKIPNDHIYVDGGAMYNYPLTYFDVDTNNDNYHTYNPGGKYKINRKTIGLYLADLTGKIKTSEVHYGGFLQFKRFVEYGKGLTNSVLNAPYVDLMRHPADIYRTVFIDTFGMSPTNFSLEERCKCALIQSGIENTTNRLKEWRVINNDYEPPKPWNTACEEIIEKNPGETCF